MHDGIRRRSWSIGIERTPYLDLEATLPPSVATSIALHLTGRCTLEWATGGRPWVGRPTRGDVTIVPAGRSGVLRVRGGPCDVLKIGIPDATLRLWTEHDERVWHGNPLFDRFVRPDPLIQQLGLALLREVESGGTVDTLYEDALTNALLAHLLRLDAGRDAATPMRVHPLSPQRTQRAIDRMASDLSRPVGLDALARELDISPSHFVAQFKARLGRTPGRYLTWLRMERARALLERQRYEVRDVARLVGYRSVSHFAQAFRAEYGEAPSRWRARHR